MPEEPHSEESQGPRGGGRPAGLEVSVCLDLSQDEVGLVDAKDEGRVSGVTMEEPGQSTTQVRGNGSTDCGAQFRYSAKGGKDRPPRRPGNSQARAFDIAEPEFLMEGEVAGAACQSQGPLMTTDLLGRGGAVAASEIDVGTQELGPGREVPREARRKERRPQGTPGRGRRSREDELTRVFTKVEEVDLVRPLEAYLGRLGRSPGEPGSVIEVDRVDSVREVHLDATHSLGERGDEANDASRVPLRQAPAGGRLPRAGAAAGEPSKLVVPGRREGPEERPRHPHSLEGRKSEAGVTTIVGLTKIGDTEEAEALTRMPLGPFEEGQRAEQGSVDTLAADAPVL